MNAKLGRIVLKAAFGAFLVLFFVVLPIYIGIRTNVQREGLMGPDFSYRKGQIERIESETERELGDSGIIIKEQILDVRLLDRAYRDKVLKVHNTIDETQVFNFMVKKGDKVLLLVEDKNGFLEAHIQDILRQDSLFRLVLAFFAVLALIGGLRGIKSMVTLLLTGIAVLYILLPLILNGADAVWVTIGVSMAVAVMTFVVIGGMNKKVISAILGTLGGVFAAGMIGMAVSYQANINGLGVEEAMLLMNIPQKVGFNFKGLFFSGVMLGTLGAVMDVSMSIASAMCEVLDAKPDISRSRLFMAGMNIGRDIMGTMSNTLILAYTGSALTLLLVYLAYELPIIQIINSDVIASEVLRALAGSIGLILAIPLTALSIVLIRRKPA